jgi:hypothetical protein
MQMIADPKSMSGDGVEFEMTQISVPDKGTRYQVTAVDTETGTILCRRMLLACRNGSPPVTTETDMFKMVGSRGYRLASIRLDFEIDAIDRRMIRLSRILDRARRQSPAVSTMETLAAA